MDLRQVRFQSVLIDMKLKAKYNKMSNHLNLLLIYQNIKKQCKIKIQDNQIYLNQQQIFKRAKEFLEDQRRSISTYINIWVESKGIKQNLFKLCKKGIELRLNVTEYGKFEIKVYIEQGSQKQNLIKSFNQTFQNYQRIKNNIERIKIQNAEYQKKQYQNSSRNLDIAFFFADPLVLVKFDYKTYEIVVKNEVSYQVQYDKFIQMVKGEQFNRNLKIEMLVATETNIKNILTQGVSILHFACHGQKNYLEIENQKKIGEFVALEKDKLLGMISRSYRPKVIIFNACLSQNLASQISKQLKIITIGYKGSAKDKYCQKFTKDFYMGVFVYERPIRQTFNKIKQEITKEQPEEGNKLSIFPASQGSFQGGKISQPTQQKTNYVVKWNIFQNLRKDDCLGVKKEMHKFIQSLTNNQSMSYFFLKGEKGSGKTNFMMKTKIYTTSRKVFTDQLVIDLKKKNGNFISTLLQMKLDFQSKIQVWRAQIENKIMKERVSCLVVIDHCQSLIQYQYSQFTRYVQQQLKQKIKWGKIVIITRNNYPYDKDDLKKYLNAIVHVKEKENITLKQLKGFISRYFGSEFQAQIEKINKERTNIQHLALVKALKLSSSSKEITENLKKVQKIIEDCEPEFIEQSEVQNQIARLERSVNQLFQNIKIQIKENYHIYLSTILEQIAGINILSKNANMPEISRALLAEKVLIIVQDFKYFYHRAFRYQQGKSLQNLKQLTRLALKIAGVCYITSFFFKQHMLNCQKMRVMAISLLLSPYTSKFSTSQKKIQLPIDSALSVKNLQTLLSQFRIQILLTLYTYFTQCQEKLNYDNNLAEQTRLEFEQCSKKEQIIDNQLQEQIHKRCIQKDVQNSQRFVRKYKTLNKIIQQIHFCPKYNNLSHQSHNIGRKSSDFFQLSTSQGYIQESTEQIYAHHAKISEYWKSYSSLRDVNAKSHNQILSKDSMVLLFLNIIKLIKFNQGQLEYLQSKGQSFFKRQMVEYIVLYVTILKQIDQAHVFPEQTKSHSDYIVWKFPENASIKTLFKKYFKMFINVYFQLEKIRQNLTKDYSLKIFNQLLDQCDRHPKINLTSIKNDIQTHKNEQFVGNYSCQTYIAIPLITFNKNDDKLPKRVNIKRFQSHVFNFQQQFFSKLQRQIKKDIFLLSKQLFAEQQQPQNSLIQLIICDCSDNFIECQSLTGKRQLIQKSRIKSLPNAPIVMIFGINVKSFFGKLYKTQESILITMDLQEEDHPNQLKLLGKCSKNENWLTIEQRIQKLEQYSFRLDLSYSLLQYFYTSFCKHFFTVDHSCFIQQVRSSFYLAKAEALIKTKIRFQKYNKHQLNSLIGDYVNRIQMSISESAAKQIVNKPAYHFLFKVINQSTILKMIGNLAVKKNEKEDLTGEVGCNFQIYDLLTKIQKTSSSLVLVYYYKSHEMKQVFISTLTSKVKKSKKFTIQNEPIVPGNLLLSRKSYSKTENQINFEKDRERQINLEKAKAIVIYQNIPEQQFISQCQYAADKEEPTTIRIFFTKEKYRNCISHEHIEQSYDYQKLEFQLFFIDYKKQKSKDNIKPLTNGFKKFIEKAQSYGGLSQLKVQLQNRNH